MKTVVVFIPVFGWVSPSMKFTQSFNQALWNFKIRHKEYAIFEDYCTVGPDLPSNRNVCVGRAIEGYDGINPDIAKKSI